MKSVQRPTATLAVIICQKAVQPVKKAGNRAKRRGTELWQEKNVHSRAVQAVYNGGDNDTLPAGGPVHGWLSASVRLRCPSLVANSTGPATSTSAEQPAASPPLLPSITD